MVNLRTFQFSHDLFWGFKRQIDLDEMESLQDCIDMMYIKLHDFLNREDFEILIKKLEESRQTLHIHDRTFVDILLADVKETIYICNHGATDKNANNIVQTIQEYGGV